MVETTTNLGALFKSLMRSICATSLLYQLQRQLVLQLFPVFALEFTTDQRVIGTCIALYGIGRLLSNIPAGMFASHFGSKMTILLSAILSLVAAILLVVATEVPPLMVSTAVGGVGLGVFSLGRGMLVARFVPAELSGRFNSLIGGINRISGSLGPIVAGFISQYTSTRMVFLVQCGVCVALFVWSMVFIPKVAASEAEPVRMQRLDQSDKEEEPAPEVESGAEPGFSEVEQAEPDEEPEKVEEPAGAVPKAEQKRSFSRAFSDEWGVYKLVIKNHGLIILQVSSQVFLICVLRAGREFLLPVQAHVSGLSPSLIGILVGLGFGLDACFVPVAGIVIDKYGRRASVLASTTLFGLAFPLLTLAKYHWPLYLAAAFLGIGNGMSGGLTMTLGTDMAQMELGRRSQILALFRCLGDFGLVIGPMLTGLLIHAFSITTSCYIMSAVAAFGILWAFVVFVETKDMTVPAKASEPDEEEMDMEEVVTQNVVLGA